MQAATNTYTNIGPMLPSVIFLNNKSIYHTLSTLLSTNPNLIVMNIGFHVLQRHRRNEDDEDEDDNDSSSEENGDRVQCYPS